MGVQYMEPGICHSQLWQQEQLEDMMQRMLKQLRVQFSFSRHFLSSIIKTSQKKYFYEQQRHHQGKPSLMKQLQTSIPHKQLPMSFGNSFHLIKKENGMQF